MFLTCSSSAFALSTAVFFNADLCLHVRTNGGTVCSKVPKGLVVKVRSVGCAVDISDDAKFALAKAAMQPSFDQYCISQQDVDATNNAGGGVHLAADVKSVLDVFVQKCDDLKLDLLAVKQTFADHILQSRARNHRQALSTVSSTISAYTTRVLLVPFGVSDDGRKDFFKALRLDPDTRSKASQLLSTSGVDISLEQLLNFRGKVCLPRNTSQHVLADQGTFEEDVGMLPVLDHAERALLTQMHIRELAEGEDDE